MAVDGLRRYSLRAVLSSRDADLFPVPSDMGNLLRLSLSGLRCSNHRQGALRQSRAVTGSPTTLKGTSIYGNLGSSRVVIAADSYKDLG